MTSQIVAKKFAEKRYSLYIEDDDGKQNYITSFDAKEEPYYNPYTKSYEMKTTCGYIVFADSLTFNFEG